MFPRYNDVMLECWAADPNARPSFDTICQSLDRLFCGRPGTEYYYGGSNGDGADGMYDDTREMP